MSHKGLEQDLWPAGETGSGGQLHGISQISHGP